ncbi:pentatricopeptide repeat-containing protein At2g03880, mitochondrial [Malania oleifera]|uniref:pentatricopeptide repeat-containing protein At2g03880, mitochondrial n=1 Tax=Malania oleifera TaxID=397392 RepID=UPI0025AE125B|nr:pentatricopeptide repeat-containing protein At2g03880, mitochondrial [Malania oleifera]
MNWDLSSGKQEVVMYRLNIQLYFFHKDYHWLKHLEFNHRIHSAVNSKGISYSILDSNQLLNALSKSGQVDEARQMFDIMPTRDECTWNTMIAAYANSGRLTEAKQLFDEAPERSSITWSSLISGCCHHGFAIDTVALFWKMQFEGQKPNQYILGSVLRACSKFSLLQRGEQIHAYAIKTQFDSNVFVATGLVDMYAKCKHIWEAEYLFEMTPNRKNHVLWTAMVTGYSQNGDSLRAIKTFCEMRTEGIEPNQFTFPGILTACAAVSAHNFGAQVHACIVHSGFEANIFVKSAMVDMYAKCGDLCYARRMLGMIGFEDVVSWNSMIGACVRQGFKEEALTLFQQMHSRNMKIDDFTYPSILNALATMMDVKSADSIHCLIAKSGFEAYQHVSNALVDMYAKHRNLGSAIKVFNQMKVRDVISWTSLVTGHAHNGFHEEAIKLFSNMRIAGIFPDQFVFASVLSTCAELTVLEFGQQVHGNFIKFGLGPSLSVDNSLITMYAKCGSIEDADRVFNTMQLRNVVTWTALIVGYAQNGKGKDSIQFYDQMIASGMRPDFITFIGLLFACSHAGLVENGRTYFNSMDTVYGIKPGPEHYACMIDLLSRSGRVVEAKELLDQMVVEPDATVWKALLSACRVHGNVELAERAAKNLFALEPQNAMPYILLSNIYSAAGRWEDAARIRGLMKSQGISKEPGCSWLEMNSRVHIFLSDDRSHPMTTQIYRKLDEIMVLIKKDGYAPDMSFALHDMDEEGKELGLAYHSEKLAIAFGLLTLPQGAPIRIFKNLRICGDCHIAMKFISVTFHRHIILRDSNCFHHFREGMCSCGDYW